MVGEGAHKRQVWTVEKREDVKYDEKKLGQGEKAIREKLKKGQPSVIGITYNPSNSIQRGGSLRETGAGGHTVLIVGCDADAKKFLYLDPYGPDEAETADMAGSKFSV
jgi:C1A family cysteine protease